MSGTSFDKKIANAFKKVGKKVGWVFKHYRTDSYTQPLQNRNFIGSLDMSYSQDDSFKKGAEDALKYFTLYCDYTTLIPGDFLSGEGRTFIVFQNNPLRGPVGVQTTHLVQILRPVYDMAADKKTSFVQVCMDLPVALENVGAVSDPNALQTTASKMTTTQTRLEIWTWVPSDMIRLNDVVEIDNLRYLIQSVANTPNGTSIKALSMKVGK